MNKYISCCLLWVFVFTFGCKEESDIQSPKILIEQPIEGSHYMVGETIPIKALISDNEIVESIEIRLNKLSNNAKVGESLFFRVGTSVYNLEAYYPLKDTLLPTDEYYITISAFDGNQEGKEFQKVNISGLPKKKLSDVVIISDGIQTDVIELKNNISQSIIKSYSSDYGGSAISSKNQMLYICGEHSNELHGFDLKSLSNRWTKTYSSTSATKTFNYLGIDANKTNVGISLLSGYTDVLSPFGSEIRSFQPSIGMIPQRHFMQKLVTYIETFSHNGSVHKMECFYSMTSAPFDSKNINFQIVDIFEENENKAYIFANLNGSSNLYEYTYNSKNIRTADNLVNDSLTCVKQISENLFLVAGKKHVYKYYLSNGSLIEFLSGIKADVMEYDQLNGEVYIGNGNKLSIYDYVSGNLKTTISFQSEIRNVFYRYNI